MEVRVRYAPSPTGMQHIGGVRTALFNYLYARSTGGKFILRLEDTDQTRYGEEYVRNLYDTLSWLGIDWDEGGDKGGPFGPYVQSQRFELYKKYALELVEKGQAYYCFCDEERLERIRKIQTMNKMAPGYDRHCRSLSTEEVKANLDAGKTPTKWTRTGYSFHAYAASQIGSSPVCRYYLPPAFGDSHFFGRGTAECNATGVAHPQFVLEDPQFMQMILPTAGNCPAGTLPIYRVFSNRPDANHRYMTDRTQRDAMVAKGWLAEGDGPDLVVMCAP